MAPDQETSIEKVLVIDDNLQNRMVAEGHLAAAGYAVVLAESGERGIELFQSDQPQLILLDILMPHMNGFETCAKLREIPGGQEVPIVFLTALGDLNTHETAMASGADDFLMKPINRTELLLRIRSLLRIQRMGTKLRQNSEFIKTQHDALLRAQQQKEKLSSIIVHDLRNPLAAILANIQYLSRSVDFQGDDREAMHDIFTSTESLHRMVVNLTDINRSEEGTLTPDLSLFDFSSLIYDISQSLKPRLDMQKLKLSVDVPSVQVTADKDLLKRLIENLLENSLKYAPAGDVIQLRAVHSSAQQIDVRVADDGPPIPEIYREKIFEKYVHLDRKAELHARTNRGLGLPFCRLAVDTHGGRIWTEPNGNHGTAFCFTLPIVQNDSQIISLTSRSQ